MTISVIIAYTQKDKHLLTACLKSLETSAKYAKIKLEFILIANGTEKTNITKLEFPIKQILSYDNLGFAKAINRGVNQAKAEWCLITCPDVNTSKTALANSIKYFSSQNIGLVGPKISLQNKEIQATILPIPSLTSIFAEQSYLYKLFPRIFYSPLSDKSQYNQTHETEAIAAIWWLVKKDTFQLLGGFNEKFFLYFEDVDFCKRLKNSDYKIYFDPNILVSHLAHQSTGGITNGKYYYKSLKTFLNYHYNTLQTIFSLLIFKIGCLTRLIFWFLVYLKSKASNNYAVRKLTFCWHALTAL